MILLDTCAIIWQALQPQKLSLNARRAIQRAQTGGGLYLMDLSFWEIAMLIKRQRFDPGTDFKNFIRLVLQAESYHRLGLSPEVADLATRLPDEVNKDPVDQMIVASALVHKLPLVTADKNLRRARCVETIW